MSSAALLQWLKPIGGDIRFQPKSSTDIEKERLLYSTWPAGEYPFEVLSRGKTGQYESFTEERTNKNGNPMIQLVLSVAHPMGVKRIVRDFVMPETGVKLHDACVACGLKAEYDAGNVTADDFIGKRGVVKLGVDKDGYNDVRGYAAGANGSMERPEEDVPF